MQTMWPMRMRLFYCESFSQRDNPSSPETLPSGKTIRKCYAIWQYYNCLWHTRTRTLANTTKVLVVRVLDLKAPVIYRLTVRCHYRATAISILPVNSIPRNSLLTPGRGSIVEMRQDKTRISKLWYERLKGNMFYWSTYFMSKQKMLAASLSCQFMDNHLSLSLSLLSFSLTYSFTRSHLHTHTCTHMRTGSRFKAVGSDFIGIVRAKAAVPQAQQLMQDDVAAEPEGEENTAHSKCC